RGWAVPWYSSHGSDFNYDFQVTLDKSVPQLDYNYRPEPGLPGDTQTTEMPGASCFLRDGDKIFHTYSAYARGLDHVDLAYAILDMTALGRQEAWEGTQGPRPGTPLTPPAPYGPRSPAHRRRRRAHPGRCRRGEGRRDHRRRPRPRRPGRGRDLRLPARCLQARRHRLDRLAPRHRQRRRMEHREQVDPPGLARKPSPA
ncbi:MAG TPA: DUF899 family protein, partial [Trebonia sp.]